LNLNFRQLLYPERKLIEFMLSCNRSQASIARELGVHRSTIKKEIDRNSIGGEYKAALAQRQAEKRREKRGYYKSTEKRRKACSYRTSLLKVIIPVDQKIFAYRDSERQRAARKQRNDWRKGRRARFRFELSIEQQHKRSWLLSLRDRNHYLEGLYRRRRTTKDWLRYNNTGPDLMHDRGRTVIGSYKRKGLRAFFGSERSSYYRHSLRNYRFKEAGRSFQFADNPTLQSFGTDLKVASSSFDGNRSVKHFSSSDKVEALPPNPKVSVVAFTDSKRQIFSNGRKTLSKSGLSGVKIQKSLKQLIAA
jgi:hypothetical protein